MHGIKNLLPFGFAVRVEDVDGLCVRQTGFNGVIAQFACMRVAQTPFGNVVAGFEFTLSFPAPLLAALPKAQKSELMI